jgi:hypothetical protein
VPPDATSVLAAAEPVLALPVAPLGGTRAARPSTSSTAHGALRIVAGPARPVTSAAQARTEVLDALVALRRDHDPVRAGALLDKYLASHGRGALREEALALAIEAADVRGDRLLGQRLARTYEAEYPQGRFRQFAHSHTESTGARPETPSFGLDGAPEPSTAP